MCGVTKEVEDIRVEDGHSLMAQPVRVIDHDMGSLCIASVADVRSLSVITMMWQYSVPCLSCVLGPQEPMKYPSFLATKVKGEKYLRLEHYGVLQVVATLTA